MTRFFPLLIFLGLCISFGAILLTHKSDTPLLSALVGKPLPSFSLPMLSGTSLLTEAQVKGKVTVLNIFASWCVPCVAEHEHIKALVENSSVQLIGIGWRDTPERISAWLTELGNPYSYVATDSEGSITATLGITGVPETYIIDRDGIIRYKLAMPITEEVLEQEIMPLLNELETP